MALISVNLGVINLFPIPVLDGGYIMFIFLEIVNRGATLKKENGNSPTGGLIPTFNAYGRSNI